MKKVILVLVLYVFAISNSYSQTKQESIKELFHLMQKDLIVDRTLTSMMPSLLKMTQRKDSTLTETERNSLNSKLQLAKDLSIKMQIDEMALYDKYFSQNEILDLIAFYKTQSGRRLIELSPKIQNDLMVIVQQKYMQEIMQMVIAMKKSGMKLYPNFQTTRLLTSWTGSVSRRMKSKSS
jgi:hypothetical protein